MLKINYFFQVVLVILVLAGCSSPGNDGRKGRSAAGREQPAAKEVDQLMLLNAAINNDLEGVSTILKQGADVNITDENKRTALMWASYAGYTEIMESLISNGADPDLRDINGRTALMFASSGPFPESVRLLLENGADANVQDTEENYTALMYAAAEGLLENVKLLIEHGADPLINDIDGDNALIFARNNNHQEVMDFLETQMH